MEELQRTSSFSSSWSRRDDVIRVVCMSDTHSLELSMEDIPAGDVLIHAGDFSTTGRLEEIANFRTFLDGLPHAQKIVIAGNHDITMDADFYARRGAKRFHRKLSKRKSFDAQAYSTQCREQLLTAQYSSYLQDSSCHLLASDLLVHGAPWQPAFCGWAYNLPIGPQLREKWDMIPDNADVVITHGPPNGILDLAEDGCLCGCPDLNDAITQRIKPRLHVFGHIHEGHGTLTNGTTLFVNACICTQEYEPTNLPIVIDLPLDITLPAVVVVCEREK